MDYKTIKEKTTKIKEFKKFKKLSETLSNANKKLELSKPKRRITKCNGAGMESFFEKAEKRYFVCLSIFGETTAKDIFKGLPRPEKALKSVFINFLFSWSRGSRSWALSIKRENVCVTTIPKLICHQVS